MVIIIGFIIIMGGTLLHITQGKCHDKATTCTHDHHQLHSLFLINQHGCRRLIDAVF